jgi:hypothetical protein
MITDPPGRYGDLRDLDSILHEPLEFRHPGTDGEESARPAPVTTRVQLIGTHLRAEGSVDLGQFARLSDYVNLLEGFFTIHDVVLLSRLGGPTRITFPDFRVRLDDIAIVGQAVDEHVHSDDRMIHKQRRRLVLTTGAHIIYGYAHMHEEAALTAFVDSTDPQFMPMTNVRVRWLADRRLAGRFPFALIHRRAIIGVATEVSSGLTLLRGRAGHGQPDVLVAPEDQAAEAGWSVERADSSS